MFHRNSLRVRFKKKSSARENLVVFLASVWRCYIPRKISNDSGVFRSHGSFDFGAQILKRMSLWLAIFRGFKKKNLFFFTQSHHWNIHTPFISLQHALHILLKCRLFSNPHSVAISQNCHLYLQGDTFTACSMQRAFHGLCSAQCLQSYVMGLVSPFGHLIFKWVSDPMAHLAWAKLVFLFVCLFVCFSPRSLGLLKNKFD